MSEIGESRLAGVVDHGWWSTAENDGVFAWSGKGIRHHLRVHKALAPPYPIAERVLNPVFRRDLERIEELESVRVPLQVLLEVVPDEDVVNATVGKEKGEAALVGGVVEDGLDDLEHRGDSSTTGDHANVVGLDLRLAIFEDPVAFVFVETHRALDVNLGTNREAVEILGHLASIWEAVHRAFKSFTAVYLEDQVNEPDGISVVCGWGILPHDLVVAVLVIGTPIPLAFHTAYKVVSPRCKDLEVLPRSETKGVGLQSNQELTGVNFSVTQGSVAGSESHTRANSSPFTLLGNARRKRFTS